MTVPLTCPFCTYEVTPAKAATGALVCPLCRNTGKTDRPDSGSFHRALRVHEDRIIQHVERLQGTLAKTVHAADTTDLERRLEVLEGRLDGMVVDHGTAASGTPEPRVDDGRVAALEADVATLRARLDEAELSLLRADVDEIAHTIREWQEAAAAEERARLAAEEAAAATDPGWSAVGTHDTAEDENHWHAADQPASAMEAEEDPATAAPPERDQWATATTAGAAEVERVSSSDPARPLEQPAGDAPRLTQMRDPDEEPTDFSDVPPVMDTPSSDEEPTDFSDVPPVMDDGASSRDALARDIAAQRGAAGGSQRLATTPDPALNRLDAALEDIDARLRDLHARRP